MNENFNNGRLFYSIRVYWISENDLEYGNATAALKDMFKEVVDYAKVEDYYIEFFCGSKYNYKINGKYPEISFIYDKQTKEVYEL